MLVSPKRLLKFILFRGMKSLPALSRQLGVCGRLWIWGWVRVVYDLCVFTRIVATTWITLGVVGWECYSLVLVF